MSERHPWAFFLFSVAGESKLHQRLLITACFQTSLSSSEVFLCLGKRRYPLQLAVDAAEHVGSPLLNSVHRVSVHTENETLCTVRFLCHLPQRCYIFKVPVLTTG